MNNFLELENEYLRIKIDTLFGGKIVEIFDKIKTVNWVWFNEDEYSNFKPVNYSDYDLQWIGGFEELYPNDKIEIINNRTTPDHGELWSSRWTIRDKSKLNVNLSCKGFFTNSEVNKKISIKKNKIFVNYEINKINLEYFLFKLHLALPVENHSVSFNFDYFKKVDKNFGNIVFDDQLNDFLTDVRPNQNKNDFVYFYGVDGKIQVKNNNNDKLTLQYDVVSLPYFWIFQSRGGWNNLNVNVLEPCNSGLKDLKSATNQNLIYSPENRYNTWYTLEVT